MAKVKDKDIDIISIILKNERLTQDSPVYLEVWREYEEQKKKRVDLILTPYKGVSAANLLSHLKANLIEVSPDNWVEWELSSTGENVAAKLSLKELILAALPLSKWWKTTVWNTDEKTGCTNNYQWLQKILDHFKEKAKLAEPPTLSEIPTALYSVSLNRQAYLCLSESVPATKADAGRRLFDIDGSGITWAILDSGIDATHRGFRRRDSNGVFFNDAMDKAGRNANHTRVLETYDFTKFRALIANVLNLNFANGQIVDNDKQSGKIKSDITRFIKSAGGVTYGDDNIELTETELNTFLGNLKTALQSGRMLNWALISPILRIPHNSDPTHGYKAPGHPHGTHVAGIIGADDPRGIVGMCPGISLYDIRVLDNNGLGDEFNILAAIQFVRWLNSQSDALVIHGVNLSLSIPHDFDSFAAGRTPVCEACQRLVAEGTIVVAAAGNEGQSVIQNTAPKGSKTAGAVKDGFRLASITDPGNAESVITVGSTHRSKPHTYGVSYFSSKGPTGDGRYKPDLLAPGEKITSLVLDNKIDIMDGTSMAAPHVSGAAALMLAKHREMIGNPQKIKEVLCKTATDLGRDRYFQGSGMLDVLRALQCI